MSPVAAAEQLVGFKRHIRAEISKGNGAYLFSERGVTALRGPHIESLAALLDGTKDVATLLSARPGGLNAGQVARLIQQLIDAGLVALRSPEERDADERALAYWDASGLDRAGNAPRTAAVSVISLGATRDTAALESAMRSAGLTVSPAQTDEPGRTELTVVCCDDYLDPALARIDAAHRKAGRPWLLAKPVGTQVWVGPIFQPGHSACWHCLATRLWGHRHAEACAQAVLGRDGPAPRPAVSVPALRATANHLVAWEATKWLAGCRYAEQQWVWTLDSYDLRGRHHQLRTRPQCAACGDTALVSARMREPVVLRPARKASRQGGGHRSSTPEQVLDRYGHLISPVTGVVKEITPHPSGQASFHSYFSGPNVAANADGMGVLRRSLRDQSGGKGVTALDAKVGALCEAVERYSATFHGDEEWVHGSLSTLGEQAIHPNDCMLFDERQYATRERWNTAHGHFHRVPAPSDPEEHLAWTPVWSLTQRQRLLPTGMLYFGVPAELSSPALCPDSNGNAAGSSIEDAVLQGLLEVIERDAVAQWWYNRFLAPGVDLDAFGDPWLADMRTRYHELSRDLWVLDVTSDLDIPVMVAVSRRRGRQSEDIIFGFGAHPDPTVALRRAVTELNQLMPSFVDGQPECIDDPDARFWWRYASVASQPYLAADPEQAPRAPSSYAYTFHDDICQDVDLITARLAERGMDALVLDQTRPDIELPVVKVIVPGMRHFWARFRQGRLYDVPVALGRVTTATGYEDLNPIPLFL